MNEKKEWTYYVREATPGQDQEHKKALCYSLPMWSWAPVRRFLQYRIWKREYSIKHYDYYILVHAHAQVYTHTHTHTHTHNSIYGRERTGIQWDFESIFITYYVPGPVLSAGLHQWPTQMFFNCVVRDKTNKLDNFRYCNIQQNRIG